MKLQIVLFATLLSATAFAADTKIHNETRTRTIGENVLNVQACEAATSEASPIQMPVVNNDGSFSTNKQGEIRYRTVQRITAHTQLKMTKCQVQENYMVQVTGSFWNSQDSEIANSAHRLGVIIAESKTFSRSQDIDMNKLSQAAPGGYFGGDNSGQMILTMAKGLEAEAQQECESVAAQLQRTVVDRSSTSCR